jgi:hypothetical protein
MTHTRNRRSRSPRLAPTGNVDEVLLTGKRQGKDLTLFQSIGLAVFGLFSLFAPEFQLSCFSLLCGQTLGRWAFHMREIARLS